MLRFFSILLLLSLLACDDIETGDPPEFTSFNASTNSNGQIQLTWSAGSDDIRRPEELTYNIWISDGSTAIDVTDPDKHFLEGTQEGVLSYIILSTVDGLPLRADTTYEVLVTAFDGGEDSDTDSESVTTLAPRAGLFSMELLDLEEAPIQLIGGKVFGDEANTLGLVYATEIQWLSRSSEGEWKERSTIDISFNSDNVIETHLVNTHRGEDFDDLFVVTSGGIYVLENDGNGFNTSDITFLNRQIEPGTMNFIYDETESLMRFTYVSTAGAAIVGNIKMNGGDLVMTEEATAAFSNTVDNFRIGRLGGDANYDFVSFGENGLEVVKDVEDDFTFTGSVIDVDSSDMTVDNSPITLSDYEQTFFLEDTSGDDEKDAMVFLKNVTEVGADDHPELWYYEGDASGTNLFENKTFASYGDVAYDFPVLADYDGDGDPDMILANTNTNSISVFAGTSKTYNSGAAMFGVGDAPSLMYSGDLDGAGKPDLVVLVETAPWLVGDETTRGSNVLVFLLANSTTSKK